MSEHTFDGFPIVADLTAEQRDELATVTREVSFAAGERVFDEGGNANCCYLIRSGRIVLQANRLGAEPDVVQTLGPGEVLGWSWLVPPYRWRLDAVAVEPTTTLCIDAVALRAMAAQEPALGYAVSLRLVEGLVDRLMSTRARLMDVYRSPRER